MAFWRLIRRVHVADSSPEYGYGDYSRHDYYDTGVCVEAETLKAAQSAARKAYNAVPPGVRRKNPPESFRFAGQFFNYTMEEVGCVRGVLAPSLIASSPKARR